jgi:hypothetical protein
MYSMNRHLRADASSRNSSNGNDLVVVDAADDHHESILKLGNVSNAAIDAGEARAAARRSRASFTKRSRCSVSEADR